MELDPNEDIVKSYIYENSRIIAQRNGGQSATEYFYVNDRLDSVRQLINGGGCGRLRLPARTHANCRIEGYRASPETSRVQVCKRGKAATTESQNLDRTDRIQVIKGCRL